MEEFFHQYSLHVFVGVKNYMYLSFHEIMGLIKKEQEKHSEAVKDESPRSNRKYSRDAFFAMREFEKEVRMHFTKKYP